MEFTSNITVVSSGMFGGLLEAPDACSAFIVKVAFSPFFMDATAMLNPFTTASEQCDQIVLITVMI